MKPFKLLLLGLALISATLITTGKSFGSPGVHKDSLKIEVPVASAMITAAADHSFNQLGEINFCHAGSQLEFFAVFPTIDGFVSLLDVYRSDHYQEKSLTRLNDQLLDPGDYIKRQVPV